MQQETPSRLDRSRLAALLLAAASGPALAQADGILAGLEGAWSGEGAAKLTDGPTAPPRRRARYAVGGGFSSASIVLRRGP
jgi:hypothetical protein